LRWTFLQTVRAFSDGHFFPDYFPCFELPT
jgi:hypothetical protein